MQLKLERGVLPRRHERRTDATLTQRILDVEGHGMAAAGRLSACLDSMSEEEAHWVWPALQPSSTKILGCEHVVDICLAAHVLDRAQDMQTREDTDAGQRHSILINLLCKWLTARLHRAPPDGLLDIAEVLINMSVYNALVHVAVLVIVVQFCPLMELDVERTSTLQYQELILAYSRKL